MPRAGTRRMLRSQSREIGLSDGSGSGVTPAEPHTMSASTPPKIQAAPIPIWPPNEVVAEGAPEWPILTGPVSTSLVGARGASSPEWPILTVVLFIVSILIAACGGDSRMSGELIDRWCWVLAVRVRQYLQPLRDLVGHRIVAGRPSPYACRWNAKPIGGASQRPADQIEAAGELPGRHATRALARSCGLGFCSR